MYILYCIQIRMNWLLQQLIHYDGIQEERDVLCIHLSFHFKSFKSTDEQIHLEMILKQDKWI